MIGHNFKIVFFKFGQNNLNKLKIYAVYILTKFKKIYTHGKLMLCKQWHVGSYSHYISICT